MAITEERRRRGRRMLMQARSLGGAREWSRIRGAGKRAAAFEASSRSTGVTGSISPVRSTRYCTRTSKFGEDPGTDYHSGTSLGAGDCTLKRRSEAVFGARKHLFSRSQASPRTLRSDLTPSAPTGATFHVPLLPFALHRSRSLRSSRPVHSSSPAAVVTTTTRRRPRPPRRRLPPNPLQPRHRTS